MHGSLPWSTPLQEASTWSTPQVLVMLMRGRKIFYLISSSIVSASRIEADPDTDAATRWPHVPLVPVSNHHPHPSITSLSFHYLISSLLISSFLFFPGTVVIVLFSLSSHCFPSLKYHPLLVTTLRMHVLSFPDLPAVFSLISFPIIIFQKPIPCPCCSSLSTNVFTTFLSHHSFQFTSLHSLILSFLVTFIVMIISQPLAGYAISCPGKKENQVWLARKKKTLFPPSWRTKELAQES